ncbi:MAG TPA: adenine phosphoribosyltransferase [Chloroflexi bacterium]|nr:adenine phosphoribosyltransferase [Chloroflexota bacterium]
MVNKHLVRQAFDNKPLIQFNQYKFLINPLTEQIPATSAELLQAATDWIVETGDFSLANKIAGEEDKGAILVASTALATGLPFGMARWYPAGLEGQVSVKFEMEYTSGELFLNGIEENDRVMIVDDMISTGGTMLALIEAIRLAKAEIIESICVAEKIEYGGVQRILNETGILVKTLVKISVAGEHSKVVQAG